MADDRDKEILIPEVLPPARGEQRASRMPPPVEERQEGVAARVSNFLGPIFSGLLLDAVHLERLRGPALIFPAILGFWFARVCNLRLKHCFIIMLASAYYSMSLACGKFIPIATIAGIYFAVRNNPQRKGGVR